MTAADAGLLALAALVAWRCGRRGLRLELAHTLLLAALGLASWLALRGLLAAGASLDAIALTLAALWLAGGVGGGVACARWRRRLELAPAGERRDRRWGWVSGAAKGGAVLVAGSLVLGAIDTLTRPEPRAPSLVAGMEDQLQPATRRALSKLGAAFGSWLMPRETRRRLAAVRIILRARAEDLRGIEGVDQVMAVADRPAVRAALDDAEIQRACRDVAAGELSSLRALVGNPRLRAMFDDPELRALIDRLDVVRIADELEARQQPGREQR